MDASLAPHLVFAKTPKGVAEINARSGALTLQARRVLIMIDGRRPVAELMAVVRTGEFAGIMTALEQQGMIERIDLAALPPRDYEEEDFADTISLLQENAAALRSVPNIHPADVAQAALQDRPATLGAVNARTADATDAAAIAARAVANASAPRANEPAARRPPTISVPPMTHEMATGKARPGTINTIARPAEPARQPAPPTVRAPLVADTGGIAVATPVRVAAAAAAAAAAQPQPAATPAPAAPAAAAAAPNAAGRSLEEEKRFVVSELYSILGPYGEQSAAKLMECATMEALREQVKVAGKRVVTFRGEKASQDFLRAVGYA